MQTMRLGFIVLAVGTVLGSCRYQDPETGPQERSIKSAFPEPYRRTTPVVGRVHLGEEAPAHERK